MLLFCAHQSATVAMFDFFNSTDLSPSFPPSLTHSHAEKRTEKKIFDCAYSIRRALLSYSLLQTKNNKRKYLIIKRMNWIVSVEAFLIFIFCFSFRFIPRNEYCILISAAKSAVWYLITVNKGRFH